MALWPVAKSALNVAEDVEEARTDSCGTRSKVKNLSTRVPIPPFLILYVLELVIYL